MPKKEVIRNGKKVTIHLPYPKGDTASARVGNYRAPVDTAGMDAEMKATMGFKKAKPGKKKGR